MFGSKKTTPESNNISSTSSNGATNSLVSGTNIDGNIKATSDIRIDGSLAGNLNCDGKVIIGPQGSIKGEVYCQNAVIEGRFEGKIKVIDSLLVKETAIITGEVDTENLTVQSGASFNVTCSTEPNKVKKMSPEAKAV
jgi:cytoskeletal protein CcmA (bactofilin family)